jgi:hypothetical protein
VESVAPSFKATSTFHLFDEFVPVQKAEVDSALVCEGATRGTVPWYERSTPSPIGFRVKENLPTVEAAFEDYLLSITGDTIGPDGKPELLGSAWPVDYGIARDGFNGSRNFVGESGIVKQKLPSTTRTDQVSLNVGIIFIPFEWSEPADEVRRDRHVSGLVAVGRFPCHVFSLRELVIHLTGASIVLTTSAH